MSTISEHIQHRQAIQRPGSRLRRSVQERPRGRAVSESIMGRAATAPGGDVMGLPDKPSRLHLMGRRDRARRLDVMGGPERRRRVDLMGEGEPRFVDSLFIGAGDR
jgi:hypothetical protein